MDTSTSLDWVVGRLSPDIFLVVDMGYSEGGQIWIEESEKQKHKPLDDIKYFAWVSTFLPRAGTLAVRGFPKGYKLSDERA